MSLLHRKHVRCKAVTPVLLPRYASDARQQACRQLCPAPPCAMSNAVAKGDEALAKAEKKLKGGFLASFAGNKYEDAAELLEKAANQYKLGRDFQKAGQTYARLAEIHLKLDSKHEAASSFVEAAKCYGKSSNKGQALPCLHKAVEYYTDIGRLGQAARNLREVAEQQEKEGLKEEAIEFYSQAAELFETENQTSEATKCRLRVGAMGAELERYDIAIETFEGAAKIAVDNHLLKYGAKQHLLDAGICVLCTGREEAARSAVERYEDIDVTFGGSRESVLLKALVDAMEKGDEQAFTDAIAEFDSIQRLSPWRTALLLRVKKRVASGGGMLDEDDLT